MAVVNPVNARIDQWRQDGNMLKARRLQLEIDCVNHIQRGDGLMYELSPLCMRIDFMFQIPLQMVDLISDIARAVISFFSFFLCCGKRTAIQTFRQSVTDMKHNLHQICISAYGVIFPKSAIEKDHERKVMLYKA